MRKVIKTINQRNLLAVGGGGQLGRAIVNKFKRTFQVFSIDYMKSQNATWNYELKKEKSLHDQIPHIHEIIKQQIDVEKIGIDVIICTAGGFQMGSIKDADFLKKWEIMNSQLVHSSLLTSHLASHYLLPSGLAVFTGAFAGFKDPAPSMIQYHTGKVATHNIALNLGAYQEIPNSATVITLLPQMIGTEANKAAMPEVDWQKHPTCEQIAELVYSWSKSSGYRPINNSFVKLSRENNVCVPTFV